MIPVNKIWLFETDLLDPYFIGQKDGITVTLENDDVIDFINIQTVTYFMNTQVKGAFKEVFKYGGEDGGIAESTGKSEKEYEIQFNMPIENRDNLNRFAGSLYSLLCERVDGSKFIVFGQFEADDLEVDNRIQNRMTLNTGDTSARLYEVNSLNVENIEYIIEDIVTPTPPPIPSIPTGLTTIVLDENQIEVFWNSQDNVDNYVIEYGTDGFTFPNVINIAGTNNTIIVTGLTPSTTYYFRIKASNDTGESGYSGIVTATTAVTPPQPFTFTVQSDNAGTSNNDQFTFPQRSGTSPNYVIRQQGVTGNEVTVTSDTDPTTITFPEGAGTYTIEIDGTDIQPHFNNGGDKDKILLISNWGDCVIGVNSFFNCDFLTEISATDQPILLSDLEDSFTNSPISVFTNLSNWDLTGVTSLRRFLRSTNIDEDLSEWDVSGVVNLTDFVSGNNTFNSPLFNVTGNTTNIRSFFNESSFNQDISGWDVSGCDSFGSLFRGATSFNQNISGWVTSQLTGSALSATFFNASSFNQNISGWNVSNVSAFNSCFNNASSFNQNLGNWNLSSAQNLLNMLSNCGMSTENYNKTLHGWVNGGWTVPTGLTLGANNLIADAGNGGSIPNGLAARNTLINDYGWTIVDNTPVPVFEFTWQSDNAGTSNNDQISFPFAGNYTGNIDFGDGNVVSYVNEPSPILHTFADGAGLYTVKIDNTIQPYFNDGGDKDKLKEIIACNNLIINTNAFYGCSNLTWSAIQIPSFVEGTNSFRECILLSNIVNSNNWDTSSVTSFERMFSNSTNFNTEINSWDVSNVNNMSRCFNSAQSYNFSLNSWDVSNVNNMELMFNDAQSFNQDLSSWDVSNVTTFLRIFNFALSFNQSLGNWDLSSANNLSQMLNNCGMSTENYNKTLHGWVNGGWTIPTGLTLGANNLIADAGNGGSIPNGLAAKNTLEITYGWTIIDNTP